MTNVCVVLITAPRGRKSRDLARSLVKKRLAACVNIVPGLVSTYWWKNKIESASEVLLIAKTRRALLRRVLTFVENAHPYTVPEVLALPVEKGLPSYLAWLTKETRSR